MGSLRHKTLVATTAVNSCFAAKPSLQNEGLASLDLHCFVDSHGASKCLALLLDSSGRNAVSCRIGMETETATKLNLKGGPWHVVTAAGSSGNVWAANGKIV